MKNKQRKDIIVYSDFEENSQPEIMGYLSSEIIRGSEVFSFEYNEDWLKSSNYVQIDPDLSLYLGRQFLNNKPNFGAFLDSSPDRWGRVLMKRREAIIAREENRVERKLFESDFLLGVYDKHRMGALRFKECDQGDFLNNDIKFSTPPWTSLRDLEYASIQLEKDEHSTDKEYLQWINMLIAPGSSLGGARPKASVLGKDGLWIAKFPSKYDEFDYGAWEMLACELSKRCCINMSESMIMKFTSNHNTFLTKRFDRYNVEKRLHFASAMTLLGYSDGMGSNEGVSYLELAEFIMQNGANVKEDLQQLWRRIVFSIAISNTDDHLRNHGFILTNKGWRLSPAYDLNPNPTGYGLKLNISETDNSLDFDLAMQVIPYFRIEEKEGMEIIRKIKDEVSKWRTIANKLNISKSEQDRMQSAFTKNQSL